MSGETYTLLQVTAICFLAFAVACAAIVLHPQWFG